MAIDKKFVCGVGKTYNYDANDNLLWTGKTMIKTAITVSTGSQKITAGQGNVLQMIYYHTGELALEQEEQQFNLTMIAKSIGSSITVGADVWSTETVAITSSAGTVLGTPIATSSGAIYGWAELSTGATERFTFSGKGFTLTGQSSGDVCVRYYNANTAARQVIVNANIIPSVVRTVVEAQMFSGDPSSVSTSTLVGTVQVEIPRLQLDGSASLSLSTTGVSSTPIKGNALQTPVAGCSSSGIYATITEVLDNANWYDNINIITMEDNDITLASGTTTLKVWAIPTNGDSSFIVPIADLTFTSETTAAATVGAHTGVVTYVATGETIITAVITNKNTVTCVARITCS